MALRILDEPKEGENCEADVVLAHGLNGHSTMTWTHPESGVCWPQEWLLKDLPKTRVMSFGYNADVAFCNTTADLLDHAKGLLSSLIDKREQSNEKYRPLIFIGHSLGGIVIKQALFHAVIDPRYKSIHESAAGIIFFGTPHQGSNMANYGAVLDRVAHTMLRKPSSKLLDALRQNSDELYKLSSNFQYQLPRLEIVSFYKSKPMKIGSSLIVEKVSALLCVHNEEGIAVDADHSQMCKFKERDDDTYEKCFKQIRRILMKYNETWQPQAIISTNKYYLIPRDVNTLFTGREELIKRVELALFSSNGVQQRRYVITGLGGTGKSEVCLKFAAKHRQNKPSITERAFVDLARACDAMADNFEDAKSWLAQIGQRWLLILDNADDPKIDYNRYFPVSSKGDIILTTRIPECSIHATVGYGIITGLELSDAKELLLKATKIRESTWPSNQQFAEEVVKVLGSHTLAIIQAGAVIRNHFCSLEGYTTLFGQQRSWLLKYHSVQAKSQYGDVFATFEVSAEMLKASAPREYTDALELLQIFAFMHSENLPIAIFERAFAQKKTVEVQQDEGEAEPDLWKLSKWHLAHLPRFLRETSSDTEQLLLVRQACQVLASSSLVTISEDIQGTFLSMHPLTHAWAKDRLQQSQQQEARDTTGSILALSINPSNQYDTIYRWVHTHAQTFIHHTKVTEAIRLYQQVLDSVLHNPIKDGLRRIKIDTAYCKSRLGQYSNAVDELEKIVKIDEQTLDATNPSRLASQHTLAGAYIGNGEYEKAEELLEQVVEIEKTTLNATHPSRLTSQHELARAYMGNGKCKKAEELLEQVVEIRKTILNATHPDRLASQHELAGVYMGNGKYEKAEELLEQVVEIRKTTQNAMHPDRLASQHALAEVYNKLKKYP
ncbi:MAG: hypothetical protein M1814_005638 [Vezdaea aestivalis]|nr:MAG: hypothetical protein M1814_005638 [Vezdaea aestivalis]